MLMRRVLGHSPLYPIAGKYFWSAPIIALLGFAGSTLEGVGIGLMVSMLTTVFTHGGNALSGGPLGLFSLLDRFLEPRWRVPGIAGIVFGFVILKGAVQVANRMLIAWVDGKAGHDIRCALARRILSADYDFLIANDPARLVTIISTDAWRASDALKTIFGIVAAASAALIFLVFLFLIDWKLSLLVAGVALLVRWAQMRHIARLSRLSNVAVEANNLLAQRMLASIDAFRLIRVFSQEPAEERAFGQASDGIRRALFAVEQKLALWSPLQEIVYSALFMGIVIVTYVSGANFASVATFLLLLYRMQPYLAQLNAAWAELAATSGPVRAVEWLLGPSAEPRPASGSRPFQNLRTGIVFHDVSFAYGPPGSEPALENASFEIAAHCATALVGRSGAGKSTVTNLLCGLILPQAGRIEVDGVDLRDIDMRQWRRRIGFAGQDVELLDGTIAENIAYGWKNAPFEAIERAAQEADAADFIRQLKDGYDSKVGTRGASLSGGQRQRIGIARALLIDPEILILDEATNAVDGLSERAILALLQKRARPLTTVVISHRASTIRECANIVVFDGGRALTSGATDKVDKAVLSAVGLVR
jgi:ABC-type multidrug transport system fused ATPase/permease subunit